MAVGCAVGSGGATSSFIQKLHGQVVEADSTQGVAVGVGGGKVGDAVAEMVTLGVGVTVKVALFVGDLLG